MMRHTRRDRTAHEENANSPMFKGRVTNQWLDENDVFKVNEVAFAPGARTRWHVHAFPQLLIITEGQGIVATEEGEVHVTVGDVLHVEPGTRHWHGADPDQGMAHLSIGGPGATQISD